MGLMKIRGYLIDTNVAIAILADENTTMKWVQQANVDKIPLFFSVVTECEVFSGVKSELEIHRIKLFTPRRCLNVDSKVARRAGHIRREQRMKGRKLKTADALIIATAVENQLAIVSRDSDMNFAEKEFGIPVIRP
jgi:tRNA(fMet)-specific endonuclease VapC